MWKAAIHLLVAKPRGKAKESDPKAKRREKKEPSWYRKNSRSEKF